MTHLQKTEGVKAQDWLKNLNLRIFLMMTLWGILIFYFFDPPLILAHFFGISLGWLSFFLLARGFLTVSEPNRGKWTTLTLFLGLFKWVILLVLLVFLSGIKNFSPKALAFGLILSQFFILMGFFITPRNKPTKIT